MGSEQSYTCMANHCCRWSCGERMTGVCLYVKVIFCQPKLCVWTQNCAYHFKMSPDPESISVSIGQGCVCLRAPCDNLTVDDTKIQLCNRLNLYL